MHPTARRLVIGPLALAIAAGPGAEAEGLLCQAEKAVSIMFDEPSGSWKTALPDPTGYFLTVVMDSQAGISVSALNDPVPYLSGDECGMQTSSDTVVINCDNILASFRFDVETTRFLYTQYSGIVSTADPGPQATIVGRCTAYSGPSE